MCILQPLLQSSSARQMVVMFCETSMQRCWWSQDCLAGVCRYASLAEEEAKDRQTEAETHIQTAQAKQSAAQDMEILVQEKRARVSSQGTATLFTTTSLLDSSCFVSLRVDATICISKTHASVSQA